MGTPVWQEMYFPDREDSAALPPDRELPQGPFSWDPVPSQPLGPRSGLSA